LTLGFHYGNIGVVTVIGWELASDFARRYPDALPALVRWYDITTGAIWRSLVEARRDFPHADGVGNLTVFNIRGNRYRLIAQVNYAYQIVQVKQILTHAEYNKDRWKA
jgi:mRNA interferase HigB